MDLVKIIEAKNLRGDIIEKLYLYYGQDIRITVLKSALRVKGMSMMMRSRKLSFTLAVMANVTSM